MVGTKCCVLCRPEPYGVRPLGGTRQMMVVCELGGARVQAGVLVRDGCGIPSERGRTRLILRPMQRAVAA
jgi:hypothetical protein